MKAPYCYILNGSLLGVESKICVQNRSDIWGGEVKDMYPLDFKEFILCVDMNDNILHSREKIFPII